MPVEITRWNKKEGRYVTRTYETVAERLKKFREECPIDDGWGINTDVAPEQDYARAVAWIVDPESRTVAVGHAEEVRGSGINEMSAVENAETSAIGRALMSAGYGGGEIMPPEREPEKPEVGSGGMENGSQERPIGQKDLADQIGVVNNYLESLGCRDKEEKLEAVNSRLKKLGYDPVESSGSIPMQAMPSLIVSLRDEAAANSPAESPA